MRRLPIRWKITLWAASATGGALLVFAAGVLAFLYLDQIETADLAMQDEARHLATAPAGEISYGTWLQHVSPEGPLTACSVDPGNERLAGTPHPLPDTFALRARDCWTPRTIRLPDGTWRVRAYRSAQRDILLAYDLYDATDRVIDLLTAFLFALPIGTAVAALGAWVVAGRALVPVRVATETAAAIEAGALDLRLPPATANDEIGRLTTVLNQMLERLEKSFRQSNRFAADASHELRTPLTIMRGELDALLNRADLTPGMETPLLSLQEEIARLNRITEHLLLLARFDTGQATAIRESVDFSALTREACEDAELLASAHQVRLEIAISPGILVNGDPGQLRRVLLNLLENACKFNTPKGLVRCSLEQRGPDVRLAIANSGPGVPPEMRHRLFERFFRTDAARTRAGHGLGLSLCREIVHAHGGQIVLTEGSVDAPTVFIMTLPASQA